MNFSLPYKVTIGFIIAIVLLAVVSYFYFSSTQSFIASSVKVQNTQKVINQLEVLSSLIKDAETGQRGFIITENEAFLSPYYSASKELENELLELSLLIQDTAQMRRYETLVPDITSMMARLDFSIDLIRRNEFDSAVSYIVSTTGKRYMDKIRSTIDNMKDVEKSRLDSLIKTAKENARYTFMAVLLGASLTSLFLIIGFIKTIDEISKKKKVEATLKEANEVLRETQENLKQTNVDLEQRVKERTKALTISEERYRSLVSATTSIVWTTSKDGEIIQEVGSWENYTGQQYEQYKNLGWLKAIHPEDTNLIAERWKLARKKKTVLSLEVRLMSKDKTYRHIQLNGVPIFNNKGNIREWIGTISDIHDRKAAAEALKNKNQEVEKAYEKAEISNIKLKSVNKVLETFVYAAAHDLKSPLINLKSLLTFINQTKDLEKKFEFIQKFGEAVMRLDNTVSGLGEIIEVQEADTSPVKKVYFQDVLDKVEAEYNYKLTAVDAKLEVDFRETPAVIFLEPYINSIFTNMITNATKYCKDDVPLLLEIKSKKESDFVVVSFKDNGIGMDLERYKSNLFKPFKRFTSKAEGKGIGLHIIKSMIEKNGGRIEVESKVGVGTSFICYLKEYEMLSDS